MIPSPIASKKNIAILLAAGRGRRLLPHTANKPKPLHKVNKVPVIDYIFASLKFANVTDVIVVVNYLKEQIYNYLDKKYSKQFEITYSRQHNLHGNLEAISSAIDSIKRKSIMADKVLICATDYVVKETLINNLINFHTINHSGVSVVLRKIDREKASSSSVTFFNNKQQIIRIFEKPTGPFEEPVISTSLIYLLPFHLLRNFEDEYQKDKLSNSVAVLNQLINNDLQVYGLRDDDITDINLNNIDLD